MFTPEVVNEARKLLHAIWLWRDLPDIPAHTKVANMLIERRQLRQSNLLLSSDIIDFLQLEDARLKVTFLTLRCEDIPSKVTEQEAMRDVYTLLSKNEYDYNKAIVSLQEKEQAYEQSIRDIRNDMSEGFEAIMAKLNNNNRSSNESGPYHTPSSIDADNSSDVLLTSASEVIAGSSGSSSSSSSNSSTSSSSSSSITTNGAAHSGADTPIPAPRRNSVSKTVTDNQLASTAINQPEGVTVDADHGDNAEESASVPVADLRAVGVMSPVAVSTPTPTPPPPPPWESLALRRKQLLLS